MAGGLEGGSGSGYAEREGRHGRVHPRGASRAVASPRALELRSVDSHPSFPDHFSGHAELYRRYRPTYPAALYRWLGDLVEGDGPAGGGGSAGEGGRPGGGGRAGHGRAGERAPIGRAWDCATGNGQAAVGLAPLFRRVVGTDASTGQLAHARSHPRVAYVAALAERTPFPDACVNLVTVAQAVHWFRLDAFWAEVRRVVRPGGVIAVWTYELFSVDPGVDAVIRWFYSEVVGPHWPPERRLVEEGYRTLPFPFDEIGGEAGLRDRGAPAIPEFVMRPRWRREDVLGQVSTWSAVRRYREAHGADPLDRLAPRLAEAWPDPDEGRAVRWPLRLRVGRV